MRLFGKRVCFTRTRYAVGLGLIAGCLSTTALPAQDAPAEASKPAETEVQAIPIEDVAEQAVRTARLRIALTPGEESLAALKEDTAKTERLLAKAESQLTRIRQALLGAPSLPTLQAWEAEFRGLLAALESHDGDLDRQLDALRDNLGQVDASQEQWQRTREAAASIGASATVQTRIEFALARLGETRAEISGHRDDVLSLRDRLVEHIAQVDRIQRQLGTMTQERLADILVRERPSIWNMPLTEAIGSELQGSGFEAMEEDFRRLKEYTQEHVTRIGLQVALFLALVVGLRLLGAQAGELADEEYDLRQASLVFSLPTAMALVIVLILTPWLHPYAPEQLHLFAQSVAVVPAVLIVSRLLAPANRPVVWALVVVFLVDRVRDVLDTLPTLERAVFLLELIGAVAFLLWVRRPRRIAEIPPEARRETLFRVVRGLTGATFTLLAIAIAAEAMGFSDLAHLVGTGTLRSAYSALFIFASLKVLQSVVAYGLTLWPLRLLKLVSAHRPLLRRRIDKFMRVVAFALWAYLTLAYFGLAAPLKEGVMGLIAVQLNLGAVMISLSDVLVLVVTIWLTFALARLIDFVLTEDVYPRVKLPRGMPYAVSSLTRYSVIFLGFLLALAAAGIEMGKLAIVAGGLGVGIGFGLQNIVNNFVSGIILLFERPLKVGDDIQLSHADLTAVNGEIRRIGIRASEVRADDGAEIIVPNSLLISEAVTNWTFEDRKRRVEIGVSIQSGADAERVMEVLLAVARAQTSVLAQPSPRAFLVKLDEGNLEFVMRVWISEFRDEVVARSQLNAAIQKALAEAGIIEPLGTVEGEALPGRGDSV